MNYYELYKALDFAIRGEERILNLKSNDNPLLYSIIETSTGVDKNKFIKFIESEDAGIILTDGVFGREFIQWNGKNYMIILLPYAIRTDEYNIQKKVETIFKALYDFDGHQSNDIYSLQMRLIPFLMTTMIMSDMYAPFDDLRELIINTLLDSFYITYDNKTKELQQMMNHINDISTSDTTKKNLYMSSYIFAIIDKDLAKNIVISYKII